MLLLFGWENNSPATVTTLSKKFTISPGPVSKITDKLTSNGLATKHRNGKTVQMEKQTTPLAQKLEEALRLFPRRPLKT